MWKHSIAVRDFVTGVSYRARLLLYALASRCNEGGWCRPSIPTLMKDTGMSRCGVLRAIGEAVEADYLLQIGGPASGGANRYRINPDFMRRLHEQVINSQSQVETGDEVEVVNNPSQVETGTQVKVINNPSQVDTPPVSSGDSPRLKLRRVVDNSDGTDYDRLLHTPGWKPTSGRDRKAAENLCYALGSTREDAADFGRYNATRNWSAINGTSTVNDLARSWVERFKLTNRAAYEYEMRRRASETRILD